MTEHFWMRRQEILGQSRKPKRNSQAVLDAARARTLAQDLERAARSACRRLWMAMEGWA